MINQNQIKAIDCPWCHSKAENSIDGKYARCTVDLCAGHDWTSIHLWNIRATDRDAELAALRQALTIAMRQWRGYAQECSQEDVEDGDHEEGQLYRFCQSALASTAGTEILERLRLAVEERKQLSIELEQAHHLCGIDWPGEEVPIRDQIASLMSSACDHWREATEKVEQQLAAVTAERDEVRKAAEIFEKGFDAAQKQRNDYMDKLAAAQSEIAGLRKAITDAPHSATCLTRSVEAISHRCDCWKASALKGAE